MPNIKRETLKGVAYTAISQMAVVKKGGNDYEKSKSIVDRWVNDCPYNIKEYFKKEIYTVDGDANTGKELAGDAWEAFEYFNIL